MLCCVHQLDQLGETNVVVKGEYQCYYKLLSFVGCTGYINPTHLFQTGFIYEISCSFAIYFIFIWKSINFTFIILHSIIITARGATASYTFETKGFAVYTLVLFYNIKFNYLHLNMESFLFRYYKGVKRGDRK